MKYFEGTQENLMKMDSMNIDVVEKPERIFTPLESQFINKLKFNGGQVKLDTTSYFN